MEWPPDCRARGWQLLVWVQSSEAQRKAEKPVVNHCERSPLWLYLQVLHAKENNTKTTPDTASIGFSVINCRYEKKICSGFTSSFCWEKKDSVTVSSPRPTENFRTNITVCFSNAAQAERKALLKGFITGADLPSLDIQQKHWMFPVTLHPTCSKSSGINTGNSLGHQRRQNSFSPSAVRLTATDITDKNTSIQLECEIFPHGKRRLFLNHSFIYSKIIAGQKKTRAHNIIY